MSTVKNEVRAALEAIAAENKAEKIKEKLENVVITIIGKGLNYTFNKQLDVTKKQTVELNSQTYNVEPRAFFIHSKRLRGQEYRIIFKEGTADPMLVGKAGDITPKMLKTAKESQAASQAIKEMFTKPFGFNFTKRKFFFVLICAVVGGVAYLVWSGQLNLGGLLG